ncbi:hypothetical protein LUW77_10745 [Streptomyces radiopugnans]|nr:hypothetical protein LUW77_10745 [Streptomyces radiopugnans]
MSDAAPSPAPAREGRRPNAAGRAGTVVGAVLLVLAHAVTGYLVFLAYMSGTANPWEPDAAAHSGIAAGSALPVTGVCALLTRRSVRAGHLQPAVVRAPCAPGPGHATAADRPRALNPGEGNVSRSVTS